MVSPEGFGRQAAKTESVTNHVRNNIRMFDECSELAETVKIGWICTEM
jgi:hypothetical protein